MYVIIGEVDGYIEEKNGIFASADKNKEVLTKYTEFWAGIKGLTDKIDDKPGEHGKDFIKIKFYSDNSLPLSKILKLQVLTVIVRSIFQEENKYYPQVFLDECLSEL